MQSIPSGGQRYGVLQPDPRWRWGKYPARWLLGGCWSLWRTPLRGLVYGAVFVAVASAWTHTLLDLQASSFAFAMTLTAVTLLLGPRLTAGLLEPAHLGQGAGAADNEQGLEERRGALVGIGALLVMLLGVGLNAVVVCFALLYRGDVPSMDLLLASVFSWHNAALVIALLLVIACTTLVMQLVALVPTMLLSELDTDLPEAMRSTRKIMRLNWRPLACWAATSQLLVFVLGGLLPLSLLISAPLIAYGSWWACREVLPQRDRLLAGR